MRKARGVGEQRSQRRFVQTFSEALSFIFQQQQYRLGTFKGHERYLEDRRDCFMEAYGHSVERRLSCKYAREHGADICGAFRGYTCACCSGSDTGGSLSEKAYRREPSDTRAELSNNRGFQPDDNRHTRRKISCHRGKVGEGVLFGQRQDETSFCKIRAYLRAVFGGGEPCERVGAGGDTVEGRNDDIRGRYAHRHSVGIHVLRSRNDRTSAEYSKDPVRVCGDTGKSRTLYGVYGDAARCKRQRGCHKKIRGRLSP